MINCYEAYTCLLNLETAMLSAFGQDMGIHKQRIIIAATGAIISGVIVVLSIRIIQKTGREFRVIKIR